MYQANTALKVFERYFQFIVLKGFLLVFYSA